MGGPQSPFRAQGPYRVEDEQSARNGDCGLVYSGRRDVFRFPRPVGQVAITQLRVFPPRIVSHDGYDFVAAVLGDDPFFHLCGLGEAFEYQPVAELCGEPDVLTVGCFRNRHHHVDRRAGENGAIDHPQDDAFHIVRAAFTLGIVHGGHVEELDNQMPYGSGGQYRVVKRHECVRLAEPIFLRAGPQCVTSALLRLVAMKVLTASCTSEAVMPCMYLAIRNGWTLVRLGSLREMVNVAQRPRVSQL